MIFSKLVQQTNRHYQEFSIVFFFFFICLSPLYSLGTTIGFFHVRERHSLSEQFLEIIHSGLTTEVVHDFTSFLS